jgi:hypothetical protein
MRGHLLGALVAVVALSAMGCGSESSGAARSTLTFDGSSCEHSGPVSLSSGDVVEFTLVNQSPADMAVVVLELNGASFEELLADDVRVFPPTDSWPPSSGHPDELKSAWLVEAQSELDRSVVLHRAGGYGTACWPLDRGPAIHGSLLAVED